MTSNFFKTAAPLVISTVTPELGVHLQKIDLSKITNRGDVAAIEYEILTGPTAPGAARVLTVYAAFSSRPDATIAELSTAAAAKLTPLVNSPSTNRIYNMPIYQIGARYLYVWFDHTALDASATLAVTLYVNAKTS